MLKSTQQISIGLFSISDNNRSITEKKNLENLMIYEFLYASAADAQN